MTKSKTVKRTTTTQKPKPFVPGSAGVPMNPKRRFGCGGKKKSK